MSGSRVSRSARKSVDRALAQIGDLAALAADEQALSVRAPSISDWSVGEQIEHLRRSDLTILKALAALDTDREGDGSPNLAGRVVLFSGFIPRGRGRAPGATTPLELNPQNLPQGLEEVRQGFAALLEDLERLGLSRATIRHPALGNFTASQMLAFAGIHHHHHLKIIREILRAARE